jgi:uncharacterized protein YgiM (DUF1202 family)
MLLRDVSFIVGVAILITACSGGSQTDTLNTQSVALTQAVQTAVAQLTPQGPTQTAIARKFTPTPGASAPQPEASLRPTETPTPVYTLPPLTGVPILLADADTNCHIGPSSSYEIVGLLAAGETVIIMGKSDPPGWWYITNPRTHRKRPIDACWVWSGTTTTEGDTSGVPIIQASPNPTAYLFDPHAAVLFF